MTSIETAYRKLKMDESKSSSSMTYFFSESIEKDTLENKEFRKVLFTGPDLQLVLMSIDPGQEIGVEIHERSDQFFRVEAGTAKFMIGDAEPFEGSDGAGVIVPKRTKHNVISIGDEPLKLYVIYSHTEH